MLKNVVTALLAWAVAQTATAQELEYKMELGGALGGTFYIGDANAALFNNMGLAGGAKAAYIFNPRMSLNGNLLLGKISGSTDDVGTVYPSGTKGTPGTARFSRTVVDLGAQFAYNFFAYGTGKGYKGTHKLTPYIMGGAGFTYAPSPAEDVFTLNFPLGIGVKYKWRERVNVGIEWSMRLTWTDKLDVTSKEGLQLDKPYGLENGSIFKNRDGYSYTLLYVTYDLFPKYRKCNNF